jgi:hypothetical protein
MLQLGQVSIPINYVQVNLILIKGLGGYECPFEVRTYRCIFN